MSWLVSDVMTTEVVTLSPEMTITEMDRLLLAEELSGAPVVEDGRLVGIASRADVIRVLYDEQRKAQRVSDFYTSPFPIPIPSLERLAKDSREIADRMTGMRVREVMTPDPQTVQPTEDLVSAAKLMWAHRFHRLPVVEDGRLLGLVTSLDVVHLVAELGVAGG